MKKYEPGKIDLFFYNEVEKVYLRIKGSFPEQNRDKIKLRSYKRGNDLYFTISALDYLYLIHFDGLKLMPFNKTVLTNERGVLDKEQAQNIEQILNDEIKNINVKTKVPFIYF